VAANPALALTPKAALNPNAPNPKNPKDPNPNPENK